MRKIRIEKICTKIFLCECNILKMYFFKSKSNLVDDLLASTAMIQNIMNIFLNKKLLLSDKCLS